MLISELETDAEKRNRRVKPMAEKMNDVKQVNYNALMVLQCLFENSDQYRHLSLKEIETIINQKYGYGPTHNTINKILHYLPDYGFDVKKGTRANPGFYLNSRYFSNGEILYLIESIKNIRNMSAEDKNEWINKMSSYLGPEYSDINKRDFIKKKGKDGVQTDKISIVDKAIKSNRQLWFDYGPFVSGAKPVRIQSNPYKMIDNGGLVRLLYGAEDENGDYYLYLTDLSSISNLYIDHEYAIIPIYKAKNNQNINDKYLYISLGGKLRNSNFRYLILKFTDYNSSSERFTRKGNSGFPVMNIDYRKAVLEDRFGSKNIRFFDEDGIQYAVLMTPEYNIYATKWLLSNTSVATVVWPQEAVNWIRAEIAKNFNDYYPEKDALNEKQERNLYNTEGGCLDTSSDIVQQSRQIIRHNKEV